MPWPAVSSGPAAWPDLTLPFCLHGPPAPVCLLSTISTWSTATVTRTRRTWCSWGWGWPSGCWPTCCCGGTACAATEHAAAHSTPLGVWCCSQKGIGFEAACERSACVAAEYAAHSTAVGIRACLHQGYEGVEGFGGGVQSGEQLQRAKRGQRPRPSRGCVLMDACGESLGGAS